MEPRALSVQRKHSPTEPHPRPLNQLCGSTRNQIRALCMLGQPCTTELHPQSPGFFGFLGFFGSAPVEPGMLGKRSTTPATQISLLWLNHSSELIGSSLLSREAPRLSTPAFSTLLRFGGMQVILKGQTGQGRRKAMSYRRERLYVSVGVEKSEGSNQSKLLHERVA